MFTTIENDVFDVLTDNYDDYVMNDTKQLSRSGLRLHPGSSVAAGNGGHRVATQCPTRMPQSNRSSPYARLDTNG